MLLREGRKERQPWAVTACLAWPAEPHGSEPPLCFCFCILLPRTFPCCGLKAPPRAGGCRVLRHPRSRSRVRQWLTVRLCDRINVKLNLLMMQH